LLGRPGFKALSRLGYTDLNWPGTSQDLQEEIKKPPPSSPSHRFAGGGKKIERLLSHKIDLPEGVKDRDLGSKRLLG